MIAQPKARYLTFSLLPGQLDHRQLYNSARSDHFSSRHITDRTNV